MSFIQLRLWQTDDMKLTLELYIYSLYGNSLFATSPTIKTDKLAMIGFVSEFDSGIKNSDNKTTINANKLINKALFIVAFILKLSLNLSTV